MTFSKKQKRYVLLDRDGTIIVERHYLSDPAGVELIPGVTGALRQILAAGLGLVVITNQSAVGRGMFDEKRLAQIHKRLKELLSREGVSLAGIYYCPHTPADHCACRKPKPGLVKRAAAELGFEPSESFVIGDKPCDIELGHRIKAVTFLVRSGYGASVEAEGSVRPDYFVNTMRDAARVITKIIVRNRRQEGLRSAS